MASIEILIEGGKATPGPPLGPALGPLGVNIKDVVDRLNKLTGDYAGIEIPVKITVTEGGEVEIEVGTPPTPALIKKALGIEKAKPETDSTAGAGYVGELSLEEVKEIAKKKRGEMLAKTLKSAVKEVIGTCVSMRVKVEGKDPKEILREIESGRYDGVIE